VVIVEEPNKTLRICLHPLELNKVIIRDAFLIPILELRFSLNKQKKWFSSFDLKAGFWKIKLE